MTRRAWIAVGGSLGLAAILTVALVIAIASGGDDEPDAAAAPPPGDVQTFGSGPDPEVQACLEEQGVEPPSPGEAPSDEFDPEALQDALEACGVEGGMLMPFSHGSSGGG